MYENSGYENESQEPFQGRYYWVISAGDPYTLVPDLFHISKALERPGPRFIPRHVWAAMLFRQQIKMKLQLFFYFTLSPPAVQAPK